MPLFRLDSSMRVEGSHSRQIADLIEREWATAHPDDVVWRHEVGIEPPSASALNDAVIGRTVSAGDRTAGQAAAVALSTRYVDHLIEADAALFTSPLYNFGPSQHLKAFIDLACTDPRLTPRNKSPETARKPAVLVVVRGGTYAPGSYRDGWDHSTPWITQVLRDVWKMNLSILEVEFTLLGINPRFDDFAEIAATQRAKAESDARQIGRELGLATGGGLTVDG